jgi:hypothetical protein
MHKLGNSQKTNHGTIRAKQTGDNNENDKMTKHRSTGEVHRQTDRVEIKHSKSRYMIAMRKHNTMQTDKQGRRKGRARFRFPSPVIQEDIQSPKR